MADEVVEQRPDYAQMLGQIGHQLDVALNSGGEGERKTAFAMVIWPIGQEGDSGMFTVIANVDNEVQEIAMHTVLTKLEHDPKAPV